VFAHNFEKTYYASSGKYESDAWRVWSIVRPVSRIVETKEKNIFVSEHHFDDGRIGVILVNNSRMPFDGNVSIREGWKVIDSMTDDVAKAKWGADNRLSLSENAGILLVVEGTKQ
jgi:hypothetical protein